MCTKITHSPTPTIEFNLVIKVTPLWNSVTSLFVILSHNAARTGAQSSIVSPDFPPHSRYVKYNIAFFNTGSR